MVCYWAEIDVGACEMKATLLRSSRWDTRSQYLFLMICIIVKLVKNNEINHTLLWNRTLLWFCTTIHRYPIFSTRYSVMCKVYTGYCGTSEIEHGLCACTVDNPRALNPRAKARGLSLRTGAQTMLYLSLIDFPCLPFFPGYIFGFHFCQQMEVDIH